MAQIGLLEDNARIAKLCATLLEYAGHQVTVFDTSQKCLHALLSSGRTLDGVPALYAPTKLYTLPVEVLILDTIKLNGNIISKVPALVFPGTFVVGLQFG